MKFKSDRQRRAVMALLSLKAKGSTVREKHHDAVKKLEEFRDYGFPREEFGKLPKEEQRKWRSIRDRYRIIVVEPLEKIIEEERREATAENLKLAKKMRETPKSEELVLLGDYEIPRVLLDKYVYTISNLEAAVYGVGTGGQGYLDSKRREIHNELVGIARKSVKREDWDESKFRGLLEKEVEKQYAELGKYREE